MTKRVFEVFLGTYNAAEWIEQTLRSLEAQDYEPFKVTIIDNCSTDNTVSLIQNFFVNFNFRNEYKLIQNEANIGAISSFLNRLELFESEWIIMIHQDDYYSPNHISTLADAIETCSDETSLIFTAMKRMNEQDVETIPVPTLSSLLSTTNRINNFLVTLQISPVNFPATALKISTLSKTSTSCHSTAFNDTELLLKIMATSDILYVPIETMHYRVYKGNASSITSSRANDLAVSAGLIEIFHDVKCTELLLGIKASGKVQQLVEAVKSALDIRISDLFIKNHTKLLISESLIRTFGYEDDSASKFLQESLIDWELTRESNVARNLTANSKYKILSLETNPQEPYFDVKSLRIANNSVASKFIKLLHKLPLKKREKFYRLLFGGILGKFSNRPFVKVWRSQKNYD